MRAAACLLALAFGAASAADPQPVPRTPRVGYLTASSLEHVRTRLAAFRDGLRELGRADGGDVIIEVRCADGNDATLARMTRELVSLPVDVLVTAGTPAAIAAKNATRSIPIVFSYAADPVDAGLVGNLSHPEGNITGLSDASAEVAGKRLEFLKPALSSPKVAAWVNPANPTNALELKRMQAAAPSLGLTVAAFRIAGAADMESAFAAMSREHVGGLVLTGDSLWGTHADRIIALASRHRLPVMYSGLQHVAAGGLMAYAANFEALSRRSALYVDKILKGAKPADLAIEQADKFEFIVNQRTARALGLELPQTLLMRADVVVQ